MQPGLGSERSTLSDQSPLFCVSRAFIYIQLKWSSDCALASVDVASGASPDYAYSLNPRTAAFTLELRDTGDHGFQLPASQIIPNGEETIDGLIAMIATAEARGFLN